MESSGSEGGGGRKGLRQEVEKALDDLQGAAIEAGGAVATQIESAVAQIKGATDAAASKAQSGAGDLGGQLDGVKNWIQSATGELVDECQGALDELQKEIEKRRQQLGLGGSGGGSDGDGDDGGSDDAK
jgi:peptidoglycan hydrolase CwlO-like protein